MSSKIETSKITVVSLDTAAKACRDSLYIEKKQKVRQVPLLLGPPGQGKTAVVEQLVDLLNAERELEIERLVKSGVESELAIQMVGPKWTHLSYRLSQVDPTDLKGVPKYMVVSGAEMCSFAPPAVFPIAGIPESANGQRVVIFLDELPQAPPSIQNLGANIIDGKIGDYTIDFERSFIVAAGNRPEDKAATFDIPRNVLNRITMYSIKTTLSEWKKWAIENSINPLVIGFLEENSNFFNSLPPEEAGPYPTPRAWHKVSAQMNAMGQSWYDSSSPSHTMLEGTIGPAAAAAFYRVALNLNQNYSINNILEGKPVKVPKEKDILFALILEATYKINNWCREVLDSPTFKGKNFASSTERSEAFLKELGPETIKKINRIYKWVSNPEIDGAFQVLLNKYQKIDIVTDLRYAIFTRKEFTDAHIVYKNLLDMMKS